MTCDYIVIEHLSFVLQFSTSTQYFATLYILVILIFTCVIYSPEVVILWCKRFTEHSCIYFIECSVLSLYTFLLTLNCYRIIIILYYARRNVYLI